MKHFHYITKNLISIVQNQKAINIPPLEGEKDEMEMSYINKFVRKYDARQNQNGVQNIDMKG